MSYQLPAIDRLGFCNVFLSAIGGDGANMSAKLLFKIAVTELDLDGAYDAKYGSEKKGTATDVSLRLCYKGTAVRTSGPTTTPHILAIFRPGLIETLQLNRGLQANATVIVNTTQTPDEIRDRLKMHSGRIVCVDAETIAEETGSRLNMPMMALVCRALRFPQEQVEAVIAKTWPYAKDANLGAFKAAYDGVNEKEFAPRADYPLLPPALVARGQIGYLNMLNGGAIDAMTHSTVNRNNQVAGYGFVPTFDPSACTGCAVCMTVCSDPGGIVWKDGKVIGLDYAFCKGCMRCVEVCPQTKKGKALNRPEIAQVA
ncbi:MAG TPA: 2-oxoacid:acceptor oxidoreductase family protein [Candidatus Latescibacteria bacterium]|nr:2-oxoacid:acceptor oxidoreductase family protein [Candidatus Latescibacterota bacterium]